MRNDETRCKHGFYLCAICTDERIEKLESETNTNSKRLDSIESQYVTKYTASDYKQNPEPDLSLENQYFNCKFCTKVRNRYYSKEYCCESERVMSKSKKSKTYWVNIYKKHDEFFFHTFDNSLEDATKNIMILDTSKFIKTISFDLDTET